MNLISFFAGAGGLDMGFEKANFKITWANEYDRQIWETYQKNHTSTYLEKRSITELKMSDIPECHGIIGGPPCQSWSEAGAMRGIKDKRGQLFNNFIEVLEDKQPLFFLAENVSGMLIEKHKSALNNIKDMFKNAGEHGYNLSFKMLNASDYGVPQDRKRVFFIGFRRDLNLEFEFPEPLKSKKNLRDAIDYLKDSAVPAIGGNKTNGMDCEVPNHEYLTGSFSPLYMSRNRVRSWNEQSFTIQAGARHAPIHPQAPKMTLIESDVREFVKGKEDLYRRLTVRECAEIQTFPKNFIFHYDTVTAGYKMIGNAVPVKLAYHLAKAIKKQLSTVVKSKADLKEMTLQDVTY